MRKQINTTPQQTNIVSFHTIAGLDEGTVIIHFTVNGVDPDDWKIICTAEGEEDRIIAATDHTATLSGLTVGKQYRFTLSSDSSLYIVGEDFVDYTVIPLILAEDLVITTCENGSLTAKWAVPENTTVELWTVRCYNENGYNKTIEVSDTTAVFTLEAKPETVEKYGFTIEFKYPLVESAFDSLTFRFINPRQQEAKGKYTVTRDSLNLRRYIVRPEKLQPGYEYFLKVPHRKFKDINGFYNDSTEVKVTLPNDDKLSTMLLVLSNVKNKYIIDLLNEKRDNILRQYIIDSDQTLTFPYAHVK